MAYVISIHPYRTYAQQFASKYSMITDEQAHIIKHTMKFMLYKDGNAWCKKKPSNFDEAMGIFFFERKMNRKKINFFMLKLVLTTRHNFTHVFILAQSDLHVFSLGARQMA